MRHHLEGYTLATIAEVARGESPLAGADSSRRRTARRRLDRHAVERRRADGVGEQFRSARSREVELRGCWNSSRSPVVGVIERQLGGVQERAVEPEQRAPLAVGRVADERVADRRRGGRGSGGCGRSRAGSRAAPARPAPSNRSTTRYSVRAGRPSTTTAIRSGSRRSRPIGASITPCGAAG